MPYKATISIIGPAIKAEYWGEFYASCAGGNVPWEIVFVGPRPPVQTMPFNFRYIQSSMKPTQCLEIAAMHAEGEYLVVAPDDVTFHHESLDWAYTFLRRLPAFSVVGMRYKRTGHMTEDNQCSTLIPSVPHSPILPICGMVAKRDWEEVGGVDRGFVGCFGDGDLFMRCQAHGGCMFISPDSIVYERDVVDDPGRLSKRFGADYGFMIDLWTQRNADGTLEFPMRRKLELKPYDRRTIMTEAQGNLEGWGR